MISTHTSRVGCDSQRAGLLRNSTIFLLTHPVWDVTLMRCGAHTSKIFLLTHPVWDVTKRWKALNEFVKISTHTSRVGCDDFPHRCPCRQKDFYSHIPCGMWRALFAAHLRTHHFYSHIPCGMWPSKVSPEISPFSFLLTHPVWDVTGSHRLVQVTVCYFYSHIPCGMWHLALPAILKQL